MIYSLIYFPTLQIKAKTVPFITQYKQTEVYRQAVVRGKKRIAGLIGKNCRTFTKSLF